ncbi:zinc ABC transporter solute-binding protein [bacterium]|nr:zinc ABC transporter solute-binding protein [bacterium]
MAKYINLLACICILSFASSCAPESKDDGKVHVVATTSIIADCISEILGDQAEVQSIMGPGVDPHLYKASQGDLEMLSNADVIIYNGLHLEGKMAEVFEKLKKTKITLAVGDYAPKSALKSAGAASGRVDPHIWFSPDLWMASINGVVDSLNKLDYFSDLELSFEAYQSSVMEMKATLIGELDAEIPVKDRVLITSHDAFSYFGDAFGFEVRGLQGISTAAEFGVKDVSVLISFIQNRNVRAIFVETSVSDKNLMAVVDGASARGYDVKIGGTLYSDALGGTDSGADTYIGMVQSNVRTIIKGLQ